MNCAAAIIIPVYDNANAVPAVIRGVRDVTEAMIVVVDDGSADGTTAAIEGARRGTDGQSPVKGLVVRRHDRNRGKGAALRTGFAAAAELGATHVATIDADGQHDPADLPRLLERCDKEDGRALVVGRRPRRMEGCPARCALGRRMSNLFVRANGGPRMEDSQSGFRVYPLALVQQVGLLTRAERYGFETELIVLAARAGWRVVEEPISSRYLPPGERVSHYRVWVDTWRHVVVHARLLAMRDGKDGPWRRIWRAAWGSRDEGGASASLAVGVFVGCSPLFGLHAPICLALGWRTGLRTTPMLVGSQVSMPPLGVLIAATSIGIGHLLLTGQAMRPANVPRTLAEMGALSLEVVLSWIVGWLVVGGGLAAIVCLLPSVCRGMGRLFSSRVSAADGEHAECACASTPPCAMAPSRAASEPEPRGSRRTAPEQVIQAHGLKAAEGH